MKTKFLAGAACAAVLLFAWYSSSRPDVASPSGSETTSTPAPFATAAQSPDANAAAGGAARPEPQRVAVDADRAGSAVRCRLVGLHRDVPWTAPVRVKLEGFDAAADRHCEAELACTAGADGAFALELPEWAAECTRFEARFSAEDPRYLELDVREKAATLRQSRLVAGEEFELPVQVVGVLTGRVVDARSGEGVAAARIAAVPWAGEEPGGWPRPETTTAADGTFRLQAPLAGDVLVVAIPMQEASLSGLRMTMRGGAIADSGQLRDDLLAAAVRLATRFGAECDVGTLALPAAAHVTGTVLAGGAPVEGVRVAWHPRDVAWSASVDHLTVLGRGDRVLHVAHRAAAVADADGRFRVAAPPGIVGELRLETSQRHPLVPPRPTVAPDHVVFVLAAPAVIRVERAGAPVPDVGMWRPGRRMPMLVTDRSGEVRFHRPAALAEEFELHAPGLRPRTFLVPADASPQQPVVVRLDDVPFVPVRLEVVSEHCRVRQIAGTLQSADGDAAPFPFARFRNDGDGAFEFAFPAGRHRLRLVAPGRAERRDTFFCTQEQEVEIGPGATSLQVQVQHGGRIAVDVRAANGLQLGGSVRLVLADGSERAPRFGNGAAGTFPADGASESENLPPGRYELVMDLGARGVLRRSVEVTVCAVATVRCVLD